MICVRESFTHTIFKTRNRPTAIINFVSEFWDIVSEDFLGKDLWLRIFG